MHRVFLMFSTTMSLCCAASCPIHLRCWAFCSSPPSIAALQDAVMFLKDQPNHTVSRFDEVAGFVSTPLGKNLGIRGWRDYCFEVMVSGTVLHSAHSWDGYQTVDISLDSFAPPGATTNYVTGMTKFVRLELKSSVHRKMSRIPLSKDRLEALGHLVWDGDGFLEVHPLDGGMVHVQ
jgi:hypothetical protein